MKVCIYNRTDNVIGETYPGLNCRYNIHEDRQYMYNLKIRSVCANIVGVEKQ